MKKIILSLLSLLLVCLLFSCDESEIKDDEVTFEQEFTSMLEDDSDSKKQKEEITFN